MITLFFKEYGDEAAEILKYCTHIYCDEELFFCGYKTHSDYILKKTNKRLDKANAWYVYYAAGKVTKLFEIFEPQKFVCFHRLNTDKIKIYSYNRLRDYYGKKEKDWNSCPF